MKWLTDLINCFFNKKQNNRTTRKNRVVAPTTTDLLDTVKKPDTLVELKSIPWIYPHNHSYQADPDGGKKPLNTPENKPIGVVLHHTVTYNLNGTVNFFKNNAVDVHFIIGHDGEVVQMVDCNRTAAHAGVSYWNGKTNLNNYYIGIEIVNLGPLTKKNGKYYDAYGNIFKGEPRIRKTQGYEYWEPFTSKQEQSLIKLCKWLKTNYNIPTENFAAHFEVSPNRKNDPAGGLSDITMDDFRKKI